MGGSHVRLPRAACPEAAPKEPLPNGRFLVEDRNRGCAKRRYEPMRKDWLLLLTVLGLMTAAPASADTSLVGWWHFNEGTGTTANDASGYGNSGAVSGAAQWVPGVWGTALSFDGSTARVQVPDSSSVEPASAISVTAWVKASGSPGAFEYILSKGASACLTASYGLYTGPNGGLMFYVASSDGLSYTRSPDAGAGVWDGKWHFVGGTDDGSAVHLYVDGNEVGSGAPAAGSIGYGLPNTNNVFVGHYDGCSGLDFTGTIDEPQIWTRALSPSDVLAVMHPFTGFFQPVDNLPTINTVKAGSAIPVKFSLGSNLGLSILPAGSPASHQVSCATGVATDAIEQTVTGGSSTLQYDPTANQYAYVWKTDKSWASSCRQLDVTLNDGTTHSAMFQFTR
jgi:Concanavalin A-like lectin/glucanases superfamily